ncbi:uncharacterized protein LOC144452231 [Glandiceps talaboti]
MLAVSLITLFLTLVLSTSGEDYLTAKPKAWWTKHVTLDFYTAGRLSAREVKYAAEVGFQSVFAVFNHTTPGSMGNEPLPTTDAIKYIATHLTDIKEFDIFPATIQSWRSMEAVLYFANAVTEMPKPTLVYCTASYSATATVLLYFLYMTQHDETFKPKFHSDDFFRVGRGHGHDYDMDEGLIELVSEITGEPPVELRLVPNNKLTTWATFWHAKFVSSDWFCAGQMRKTHIPATDVAGFKVIANTRLGLTSSSHDTPSQEEVTLLNIKDYTGTYKHGGRQKLPRLLKTRIDPKKPNEYISSTSRKNFEARNPGEFGDDIGYNEKLERDAVDGSVLYYVHLPVAKTTAKLFFEYVDDLKKASEHGPVLLHSGYGGHTSAYWALLAEGYMNCLDTEWALTQADILGYYFTSDEVQVFREVFDSPRKECAEKTHSSSYFKLFTKLAFFFHLFGL